MFIFKVTVTLLIFVWFHLRLFFKYRKLRKQKLNFNEEGNYLWAKRYSRYLLWLYGYKTKTTGLKKYWIFRPTLIVLNSNNNHFVCPLLLIKINDFEKNPPVLFVFTEQFWKTLPKTLSKFYSFVNVLSLENKTTSSAFQTVVEEGIAKIQIPRSVCLFLRDLKKDKLSQLLTIASGGFASLLLGEINFDKKRITLQMKQVFTAKDVVKLKHKSILKRIEENISKTE